MAFKDTLFQLGMDLTRSSTAQKEDHGNTARVARSVGSVSGLKPDVGRLSDQDGVGVAGNHLIIDLFGARGLDDAELIERTLRRCAAAADATVLHVHLDCSASTAAVTGFAVLDRGHVSVHTHPDTGFAALDVFLRGDARMGRCVDVLEKAFSADRVTFKQHQRGDSRQPALATAGVLQEAVRGSRSRAKVRKAA